MEILKRKIIFLGCNKKHQIECDETCLAKERTCNIFIDCDDRRDESHCMFRLDIFSLTKEIKGNFCKLKYDSMYNIITKSRYPYTTLENCENFKCSSSEYKCAYSNYCISIDKVCDGINHCMNNDDEMICGEKFILLNIFLFIFSFMIL